MMCNYVNHQTLIFQLYIKEMSVKGNNHLTELEEPVMIDHNHRLQRQHVNNNNRLSEMTRKRKEMGKFITKGEFPTYLFHST